MSRGFHSGFHARPIFRETRPQFAYKRTTKRALKSAPFCILLKPLSRQILPKRLALGELEGPARLGLAVLLALDHAGIAGEKAALLEHSPQLRLEIGQRLGDAVTDGAGLAGQTTAGDRADHVILAGTCRHDERLLDHHAQHGTGEIDLDLARVDCDLAGAGLDPDAGGRVLALAGGIGAIELVDLFLMLGRIGRHGLELRELVERLNGFGHDYAALVFLRFNWAMSSFSGVCASCG